MQMRISKVCYNLKITVISINPCQNIRLYYCLVDLRFNQKLNTTYFSQLIRFKIERLCVKVFIIVPKGSRKKNLLLMAGPLKRGGG